ncbi:MAG TPA: formyltransferase family protein [Bacteroidia bacterium]|jgi:methionyl-tRNA formyltransferase|nr:formyltransferase family protein [Bacteroidia bacterium]
MVKIVMCGNHIGGKPIIEALLAAGYKFAYFVCLTPEQAIENNVSGYYDYTPLAKEHNISVYIPENFTLKSEKDLNFFHENKFDLLIQGGWQRLFPGEVLNTLSIGALGYHGSSEFLPKGRGRSPMNWSLIEDKKQFIMHLFLMKEGADDGDVIDYEIFEINDFDDIETLYFKYAIVNKKLVLRNIDSLIKKQFKIIPQEGEPTYYAKRTEKDGEIKWETMSVRQIYNLIRAVTRPYPGAWTFIEEKKIIIWKARPFDTKIKYTGAGCGEIVERFENKLVINCMDGLLLVDEFTYGQ